MNQNQKSNSIPLSFMFVCRSVARVSLLLFAVSFTLQSEAAEGKPTAGKTATSKPTVKSGEKKADCAPGAASANPSFHDFKVKDVDGADVALSQYKGQIAVVVNTASKCGYTGQYKDLQALYEKYKDKGVVVLGFPSNDFGGQEPGTNKEIKSFCELNYNVKFPLFSKASVSGSSKQPVYQFLTSGGDEVSWNFEKFIVDRSGKVVGRFKSRTNPLSDDVTKAIETQIATPWSKVESAQCL